VAEGLSNQKIAKQLWVTEQTVKFHLSNIYRKLGVANRTEASRWAHRRGLLPPQIEKA
jgi:DNA-binding NarL/FixJ family response regulator